MSPDWISALSDVVSASAVVVGVVIAVAQLNAWREQSLAERKSDLAVDLLLHAEKLKEELLYVRRPLGLRHDENGLMQGVVDVFARRLKEIEDLEPLVDQLASAGIRQRVIIGSDSVDGIVLRLIKSEESLKAALQTVNNFAKVGLDIFSAYEANPKLRQAYAIAVERDRENDDFRMNLRSSYQELQRELTPIVRLK